MSNEIIGIDYSSEVDIASEEYCWVCRTCSKQSTFSSDPNFIPRGWEDCPVIGLRCNTCVTRKVLPQ